jgi:hypothetical protein
MVDFSAHVNRFRLFSFNTDCVFFVVVVVVVVVVVAVFVVVVLVLVVATSVAYVALGSARASAPAKSIAFHDQPVTLHIPTLLIPSWYFLRRLEITTHFSTAKDDYRFQHVQGFTLGQWTCVDAVIETFVQDGWVQEIRQQKRQARL